MVTFDNQIVNVGKFNGNLTASRLDYERAKQGSAIVEDRMSALEAAIKQETGYDEFNMPREPESTDLTLGEVVFHVKSERRTKKPQYKTAVTEMENYLHGISFLVSQGRTITGIARKGRSLFVGIDKLLEAYETMVAGVLQPEVKHTIRYDAPVLTVDAFALSGDSHDGILTTRSAIDYVRMDTVRDDLASFVKAYEAALAGNRTERTRAVTRDQAYKTQKSTAEGVDWAYVVKTLISVPTDTNVGELNVLADMNVSKAEKERQMPTYRLMYREVADDKLLYVGVGSVNMRIQQLKGEQTTSAQRLQVTPVTIV